MTRRRYVMIKGNLVEVSPDYRQEPLSEYHIVPDIQSYRSMIDGSLIGSRSVHRAHLRAHGCIEVGNDSSLKATPKPLTSPPGLKETLIRVAQQKLKY